MTVKSDWIVELARRCDGGRPTIVCKRADQVPAAAIVPGVVRVPCDRCSEQLLLSRSSQEIVRSFIEKNVVYAVLCRECYVPSPTGTIQLTDPQEVAEIRDRMERRN